MDLIQMNFDQMDDFFEYLLFDSMYASGAHYPNPEIIYQIIGNWELGKRVHRTIHVRGFRFWAQICSTDMVPYGTDRI